MTKCIKKLDKMRNNPRDWKIEELEVVAGHYGITVRKGKGSHVTFAHPRLIDILTIPAHRPVKSLYVKKLVLLIDMLKEEEL